MHTGPGALPQFPYGTPQVTGPQVNGAQVLDFQSLGFPDLLFVMVLTLYCMCIRTFRMITVTCGMNRNISGLAIGKLQ